jgi:hypothetical protein
MKCDKNKIFDYQKEEKTMKSLTTDDILGAKPKIRHAPRNLIRDQRIAQQPSHNPYST